MSSAFTLRSSPSGAVFAGTPGDVLTLQADGKAKFSAFGAGAAPLTKEFWVDAGRTGSSETGSADQPFLTIQAAIDELHALAVVGTVLVADGDYSAEALTIADSIQIVVLSSAVVEPASITITGAGRVELTNLTPDQVDVTGTLALVLNNGLFPILNLAGGADLFANHAALGVTTVSGAGSNLLLRDCSLDNLLGTATAITAFDSTVAQNLNAGVVSLWDTTVTGGIDCNTLNLHQSPVAGIVQAATAANLDSFSVNALRHGAHGGAHTLTSLAISDRPFYAAVFTVPALAAAFADVTIATPFVSPHDTFSVAPSANGAAILANVAPVAVWSGTLGHITVRFFGTTAGGTAVLDITQNTNSG